MAEPRLSEIWRYPVKSMAGEMLSEAKIGPQGVAFDRQWCLYDTQTNTIGTAKRIPGILNFGAKLAAELPARVAITFSDGETLQDDDPDLNVRISEALDRDVQLRRAPSKWNFGYYKRRKALTPMRMRMLLGINPKEPLPDLSRAPLGTLLTVGLFESPPGTHFDAQPLHIVTRAALERFEDATSKAGADVRRFRPNLVIDGMADDMSGPEWVGRELRIGGTTLKIVGDTLRCSMPAAQQVGLDKDAAVNAALRRPDYKMHFGVYATVVKRGRVASGDAVRIEDYNPGPVQRRIDRLSDRVKKKVIAQMLKTER
ncbi:MAG: MOSC N-terminal beta barrel domain-containing protein [Pseudomonadota bacterium]